MQLPQAYWSESVPAYRIIEIFDITFLKVRLKEPDSS